MLQKVVGTKLYEQVVEQIKDMVARGAYGKGDLLPSEKELMELTGVSRITVREALKTLAEVGIIETHKGKGSVVIIDSGELASATVDALTREQCRETFLWCCNARLLIEPEVARHAAIMASDADVAELEKCLFDRISKTKTTNTEAAFVGFHRCLFDITGNPVLIGLFDRINEIENGVLFSTPLMRPEQQTSVSAQLNRQHSKVFEAVKNHDGEFAYFYMKEHMTYLSGAYADYFDWFF